MSNTIEIPIEKLQNWMTIIREARIKFGNSLPYGIDASILLRSVTRDMRILLDEQK